MKSQELSEFFSLIGQAKKEKEEEFDNLLKEANVDLDSMATSLFTGIENAKVEVKEQKKKEEKLIKSLDSLLVSLDKPKETTPVVVGVPEDFDISSLEEEVEESPIIGDDTTNYDEWIEEEVVEEETVEEDDTISKAIKFIDTQLKEELKDIEPNDPTVDSIKAEVKELRNILYKVLAHGPGSGETRLENLDDVDKDTVTVNDKFIKYDSSIGKFIGADPNVGAGVSVLNDLNDVTITSVRNHDILVYDEPSEDFINEPGVQRLVLDVRNNNIGYALTVGTPVYQSGYNSGQDRINVETSNANTPGTMPAKGLVYSDIANNTNGKIIVQGELEGVDTSAFEVADELYVAPDGGLTSTKPTGSGQLVQKIAVVLKKSASNGALLVYGAARTNDVPNEFSITGIVTAGGFVGPLTGNVTGNLTGNADSATTATTATNAQGLTGTPDITVGSVTADSANFSGNVSIGGTLTYEDVTNIDSVGLITARNGIVVGSGITLSKDGDIFATGITSSTKVHVGVDTGVYGEDLVVTGDARVTGILTIGTCSIVLDPTAKQLRGLQEIVIGIANTITIKQDDKGEIEFTDAAGAPKSVGIGTTVSVNTSGIITASSFVGGFTGDLTGNADTATNSTNSTQLNSQSASYYLDYNNFTNTPTIPTNNNQLTNGAGYLTASTLLTDGAFSSATATTTTTSQTAVDTFAATTYRSVKYQIQITRGSEYHITEVFIVHDGTTSYGTEYATIKTGSSLASFDTDIDSGNVRLLATPTSSSSTVFKLVRTLIKV